ncbi:Gfo/Idh/MocA family protein [Chitinophaga barathri]|uniref:Gfo/Idh/MocA family oxidoreductase n=1 Tax=Chitinophaga barathri TaxID=1647451 RepID=A0A3N4MGQ4_9BACT|nr:Gfo/Idh/MocA family oxidoreductase [Chitinophaga barathri]RPD42768.1 gfo/Idh/MocA family oxidoreductase [Chitinophaga barathri]
MTQLYDRRKFLQAFSTAAAGAGLAAALPFKAFASSADPVRIGIIGCDSSHAVAFAKSFNSPTPVAGLEGFKVMAAFAEASPDIENNLKRLPGFVEELKKLGVEMTGSIDDLITKVDVIMVESNDGRPHLRQALPALKAGKKVFIDKPLAASLAEGMAIFDASRKYNAPVFSASSLRYMESAQAVVGGSVGKVLGADTFSPCHLEKTHPDIFWYGIHGVETLFTVMGPGCKSVTRTQTENAEVIVGVWEDGRVGTFRGTRYGKADYGGTVYGEKGVATLGPFKGYVPLVVQIAEFFRTGKAPVQESETLEILAFMEAADESKKKNGASVTLESMISRAKKHRK